VLANGFYEWQRDTQDRPLQPWYVTPAQQDWIAIAAFREPVRTSRDAMTAPDSVCVLTTHPNALMQAIHDRMPVLLGHDAIRQWLAPAAPEQLSQLLVTAPEDWLTASAVSPRVNAIRHDDPALHAPVTPETPRQGDLFH
jgi:putative SOS response-associated peptidase YedK